jgi:hypothetical protein
MTDGASKNDQKIRGVKAPAPSKPSPLVVRDPSLQAGTLKKIGGSSSDDWNNQIANDAINCLWLKHSGEEDRRRRMLAAVDGLVGIKPQDELEGMMAAQLIASHSAAIECYRRAMLGEQTFEGRKENLGQANKLSRTFAVLVQALNHHRGKGQQKVTVEHVHVHAGGQAIVGNVNPPGGGDQPKSEEQADAKQIAHAPEQPLRSADPARDPLPVASDAERSLPDAWRPVARRAEG